MPANLPILPTPSRLAPSPPDARTMSTVLGGAAKSPTMLIPLADDGRDSQSSFLQHVSAEVAAFPEHAATARCFIMQTLFAGTLLYPTIEHAP